MFCSHFGSKCKASSLRAIYTALNNTLAKTMSSAIAMHLLDNARPMNERLEAILGELGKDKLFKETHLSVEQILVHPRNSFNLGLNPWHVHTIGAEVQKTGAMKEAHRSVAIELSPHEEIKKMQIAFNERLVERADGKLAKVNGSERAMSIGGSHLAAFCKAANKSCTTPQPSLQDEDEDEDGIIEDEKGTSSSQLQG